MPFEREMDVLEEAIRRLGVELDAFLYGTAAKPPLESRRHVDEMIRRLSTASLEAAAERYRFSTLQGRYTAMTERWERLQSEKESGRRPGLYGHFVPGSERPSPSPMPPAPNAAAARSVEPPKGGAPDDRRLFDVYLEARRARGEDVSAYAFDKFAENLSRERARLKDKLGAGDIVFEVAEREGKVKLIAKRAGTAPPAGESK